MQHIKAVRLSVLRTGRLYPPPKKYSWYSFLLGAESTPGHSAAGRIMSLKNSNDTIGNRTSDLPACSAVPQPNSPPCKCSRTPFIRIIWDGKLPDTQKIRLTGFFFENRLHWQFEFQLLLFTVCTVPASELFDHAWFEVLEAITLCCTWSDNR